MTETLTLRPELDRRLRRSGREVPCSEPGCSNPVTIPMLIEPPCHEVSVLAEYHGGGEVVLVCGECMEPFMTLQVAG